MKIFRTIRRSLLQSNQMRKYFKYALGEILLVVIGILIALQINNWSEERKLNKERTQLLKSIKADLESDVKMITNLLTVTKTWQEKLQAESVKISSPSFSLDSLVGFINQEAFIYFLDFNGFNNNTYSSAKSSGKIEIIKEDIKRELFDLSVTQERIKATDSKYYDVHLNEVIDFNGQFPINTPFNFIKGGSAFELMWSNIDKKELVLKLNDWGSSKLNLYRIRIMNFEHVLEKTKAVLELMETDQ